MSVANHDPDFDLAKGSHQVAFTRIMLAHVSGGNRDAYIEKKV